MPHTVNSGARQATRGRRAIGEFELLRAVQEELPNEPISRGT